jgi:hypothetical protein
MPILARRTRREGLLACGSDSPYPGNPVTYTATPLRYRPALHDFISSRKPTLFVTLAFNRDATLKGVRRHIARFHARLDNAIHGHDWSRHPSSIRTDAFWFAEHLDSNGHAHGLLTIPKLYNFDGVFVVNGKLFDPYDVVPGIGRSLAPSTNCDIRRIYDLPGSIEYAMKDWRDPAAWLLASEFHSPVSLTRR